MADLLTINPPSSFIAPQAIVFGQAGAEPAYVHHANPLPVIQRTAAATSAPVNGTMSASGTGASFSPDLDRAIWLTLSGNWGGTVSLERSIDTGATWWPVTLGGQALGWTGNLNEPVAAETVAGALWRLGFLRTAGTLIYEVRQ